MSRLFVFVFLFVFSFSVFAGEVDTYVNEDEVVCMVYFKSVYSGIEEESIPMTKKDVISFLSDFLKPDGEVPMLLFLRLSCFSLRGSVV